MTFRSDPRQIPPPYKLGRKFIGTELKPSYFRQAVGYLQSAESQPADLFSEEAA